MDYLAIDLIANIILLTVCMVTAKTGWLSRSLSQIVMLRWRLKVLLLTSVWISVLLGSLFSYFYAANYDLPEIVLMGVLTSILIIIVGIMCPALILKHLSVLYYENLADIMDKQVQAQVLHYEAASKMNADIRKFQHDYANLRIGIAHLLERQDIDGALDMLNANALSKQEKGKSFKTGSLVLDALLEEKATSALMSHIFINFEGSVPNHLLSPSDICVIFGNALDNAIEACKKLPKAEEKKITIKSVVANKFLFIVIENPITEDVEIVNNAIATTKKDKHAHGIGLRSIRTAVEKYSGTVTLSSEENTFKIDIELDFNDLS
ncbi:MAG: GHKL domain-containing protein [Oscillospiraceae bacterium]|nr:GHKL domain-containing protein [Oscillospiraceae bacterium]